MGVHGGRFGAVNGISTVTNWSLSETSKPTAYKASNTAAGTGRRPGIKDWTGGFEKMGGVPGPMPSDILAFIGYVNPISDIAGSVGPRFSGNVIIDSLAIAWDFTNGAIIKQTYAFGGAGPLTYSASSTAITDSTSPDVTSALEGAKLVVVDDDDEETEICDVASMTLSITAANPSYANSCTGGFMARKAGPIDWTLAVVIDGLAGDKALLLGSDYHLRLYIDTERFYELTLAHCRDATGLTVDIDTGAIIKQTINFDMNGILADGSLGEIILPDETTWWPFS